MVPYAAAALAGESSADSAVELTRILVHRGGPSFDGAVTAAWGRIGPAGAARAAAVYVGARGVSALAQLNLVRAAGVDEIGLVGVLRAARPDAQQLEPLIRDAIRADDAVLYRALLATADDVELVLGDAHVLAALDGSRTSAVQVAAVVSLLGSWDGQRALSSDIKAALATHASHPVDVEDIMARVTAELARRASGTGGAPPPGWAELIGSRSPQLTAVMEWPSSAHLLTEAEQARVRRTFSGRSLGPSVFADAPRPTVATHTADPYPTAFVRGIFALTGCTPRRSTRDPDIGAGRVTLRQDGRAATVGVLDTGARGACAEAVRFLLMTHVASALPTAEGEQRLVMVPLDAEYLACLESQSPALTWTPSVSARYVEPPRKTWHVNPVYPPSAYDARVQGTVLTEAVIGTAGCVHGMAVSRGVDPRLDLEALRSISGWRFSPLVADGSPTPVRLTISVTFSLR